MSLNQAPKIDPRTEADVARQLQQLIGVYAPAWNEVDSAGAPTGVSAALIGVAAHFAEIIIQRLNQVPQKNFLAFLKLVGAALLPPEPARAPVTFLLAKGAVADAVVPSGTQVAAPPAQGQKDPVIFETENELVVTAAQLAFLFLRDPQEDSYADYRNLANPDTAGANGIPIFHGNRQFEHILYLGDDQLLNLPGITHLTLTFSLTTGDGLSAVDWQIWDGTQWTTITSTGPGIRPTPVRTISPVLVDRMPPTHGEISRPQVNIDFGAIPALPQTNVNGTSMQWMRGRLTKPITPDPAGRDGMLTLKQLPKVMAVGMTAYVDRKQDPGVPLEAAFTNQLAIDLSKDFYPFGEKPKFNDVFWLALDEAFSQPGAVITLVVELTNPTPRSAVPVTLSWEVLIDQNWAPLGTSTPDGSTPVKASDFKDDTKAFTVLGKNVVVSFTLPLGVSSTTVNGIQKYWLRVRIQSGNYGTEVTYKQVPVSVLVLDNTGKPVLDSTGTPQMKLATLPVLDNTGKPVIDPVSKMPQTKLVMSYEFQEATFHPPSIKTIKVKYSFDRSARPAKVLAYNDLHFKDVTDRNQAPQNPTPSFNLLAAGKSFVPFEMAADVRPTLYLGFVLPPDRPAFPNETVSLFFRAADLRYGQKTAPLWPDISREAADPSLSAQPSSVTHTFFVTNPGLSAAGYTLKVLGAQWKPVSLTMQSDPPSTITLPASISVPAGGSLELDLQVTVPPGTQFGTSDSGFLQLVSTDDQTIHTSEFITFSHEEPLKTQQLRLAWNYWNGQGWMPLAVRDSANNLTTSGVIEFLAPPDIAMRTEFGAPAYWLRVCWEEGEYDTDPRINRVLLNTTMASQTITISNEVLGSSDSSASQAFRTTRSPVLTGQSLQVRELEMPSGDDLDAIMEDEGENAVSTVLDAAGKPVEIWVRWHEVQDFYGSGPRSRHYTLDNLTGTVTFGDGLSGFIPPFGTANLRLARYRTGGGVLGNCPAGSIVQLKTTIPYIDKVTNYEAATGGAEPENLDSLISRAPTELRHRHRAVTIEDYQDLAKLASPDVARALCVPNRDLVADPIGRLPIAPGNVSLIIVPNTPEPAPQPSVELVRRAQDFISSHCPVTVNAVVVGPLYLGVNVQVEIGLASLEGSGTLLGTVRGALDAFLHPLTGGFAGEGWEFGREPHRSDFYRLLNEIPEVDHVRSLTVDSQDPLGIRQTGRFLVYSGTHTITLVFEPS